MATKRVGRERQSSLFASTAKVPQMPEGYYSGDQPNPHLRAFVEAHLAAHPYDPATDDYAVPAFNESVTVENRRDAINDLHIYWSKKAYKAILEYVRHYTQPGDLVLDPFCGSGSTALAALMEGRAAIAIDRSPAATFITKNYCTPVDVDALVDAFEELKARVKPEIDWLYATRCDRCDGPATTGYTVYSQVFQCPRCLSKAPLFDCVEVETVTKDGKAKMISVCPVCYAKGIVEEISTRGQKFGAVPVLVSYLCENGCKPVRGERRHNDDDSKKRAYFECYDQGKLKEIEEKEIPHWYPTNRMMNAPEDQKRWALLWRPYLEGIERTCDLFTRRNLWALASILTGIHAVPGGEQDKLLFALSGAIFNATKMYQQREAGGGPAKGTYYVPPVYREVCVWTLFEQKYLNMVHAADIARLPENVPVCISTQSAMELQSIRSTSIDYVFTDPPYSWKVQFGELNFLWETWLRFDTHWHDEEIIVNEVRGKSEFDWANMMRHAMSECYRVLKPGRWLSLCYHDTSEGTWELVQDILAEVGFLADQSETAQFIDTGQKAWKQLVADKITKRDLVINFRKPRPGEAKAEMVLTGDEDEQTFGEKVREIIREYLAANPGAAKDRIYDEVVSRMVRAGQMEAHDFDTLLVQVADEVREPVRKNLFENEAPNLFGTHEMSRWYLKEQSAADVVDEAESNKEDAAARSLTTFMRDWLRAHPAREGVHYSDLFERYIYAVREKPRRALQEWLPDYFYKADDGTWRPPANEEEEQAKAQARANGTSRRIKRFLSYVQHGLAIPERERPGDATLAGWIRHCRRAGLYEQGTQLYEQGGLRLERLSEEAQVEVEEDYQVCVRQLARKTAKEAKRGPATGQMVLELDS